MVMCYGNSRKLPQELWENVKEIETKLPAFYIWNKLPTSSQTQAYPTTEETHFIESWS